MKSLTKFDKQKIAIEHTLKGMTIINSQYASVLSAFEISKKYHNGTRKDGFTKEFQHQLDIVGNILTYSNLLIDPVSVLILALLHDTPEDYSRGSKVWSKEEERDRLKDLIPFELSDVRDKFGHEIAQSVNALSKVLNNFKKPTDQYFHELSLDRNALIIKAEDRYNNLNTMFNVFTIEKQRSYAQEVFDLFIPAIKRGEQHFPEQANVYQMLKIRLKDKAIAILNMADALEKSGLDIKKTIPENIKLSQNQSKI